MKLKNLSIIAACAMMLAGCVDEQLVKTEPVVPGSDVSFKLGINKNTRTYYAYAENAGGANVDWADSQTWNLFWTNGDRVNIVSPDLESPASPYKITVPAASAENPGQNQATGITTINANGIQWGDTQPSEENPVRFYSVFPESYKISFGELGQEVKNDLIKTQQDDTPVTADLHIRRNQIVMFTQVETHPTSRIGMPIDRASNTEPEACQNNPDAIMYAQTSQTEGGNVYLTYHPLSTVLHIKIEDITGGPDDKVATVYGFKITAPESVQLVGDFTATFDKDCTTAPTITGRRQTGDNVLTVSTLNDISGHYLTCSTEETRALEFNVFTVPLTGESIGEGWTMEIETDYGDFVTSLNLGTEGNGTLEPGQIHFLPLAKVDVTAGSYELKPESWMSEIPSEVYATELTLPGAWYATTADYQGSGVTIESLYNAGVRAFSLETRSSSSGLTSYTNDRVVVSGTSNPLPGLDAGTTDHGSYGGTQISSVIQEILTQVAKTPEEFSVLVLSYAGGGKYAQRQTDYDFWLGGVQQQIQTAINNVTNGGNLVFGYNDGKTFTPHTTVGDVRGKLVIKINMDDRFQNTTLPTTNFPVILAYTSYTWQRGGENNLPEDQQNLPLMSHGRWITEWTSSDFTNLTGTEWSWTNIQNTLMSHQDGIHFAYTNSNRVYHLDEGESNPTIPDNLDIPTSKERQNSIATLVNTSQTIYQSGAHNVWFQIGAGGVRAENSTDETLENAGQHVAVHFNQFFYNLINAKIERNSPSPLGLVLCNYITKTATTDDTTEQQGNWITGWNSVLVGGGTVGGDWSDTFDSTKLIDVILKMNNMFYLQRDPNWTPDKNVQSAAANYSSGMKVAPASAGGWVAF